MALLCNLFRAVISIFRPCSDIGRNDLRVIDSYKMLKTEIYWAENIQLATEFLFMLPIMAKN